ncbi:MAG: type II toxin-antitoxin system VapC family toxin [Gaiella sp.]
MSSESRSRGLADTTVFVARESGRGLDVSRLPELLGISVITIGELHAGVLAASDLDTRTTRLRTLTEALALDPIPIDGSVAEAWGGLRVRLRDSGLRMPVNDSWIAATALAHGLPVVTQDDDYVQLEGLDVVKV